MKKTTYLTKLPSAILIIILSLTNITPLNLAAKTYKATRSGAWDDPATWDKSNPSTEIIGDKIIIPYGITVDLTSDLIFFKKKSELVVDGSLNGATYTVEIVGSELNGEGEIVVDVLYLYEESTFGFSGVIYANELTTSIANIDLRANLNVADELVVGNGFINIQDGYITLAEGATITMRSSSLVGAENFTTIGKYSLVYTGLTTTTGFELIPENLQQLECSLNSDQEMLHPNRDVKIIGNVVVTNGMLDIQNRKLTVDGSLECVGKGSLASNYASNLILRGSGDLAFAPLYNILGSLSISGDESEVAIHTPLYVENVLDLASGKLKAKEDLVVKGYFSKAGNAKFRNSSGNKKVVIQ